MRCAINNDRLLQSHSTHGHCPRSSIQPHRLLPVDVVLAGECIRGINHIEASFDRRENYVATSEVWIVGPATREDGRIAVWSVVEITGAG